MLPFENDVVTSQHAIALVCCTSTVADPLVTMGAVLLLSLTRPQWWPGTLAPWLLLLASSTRQAGAAHGLSAEEGLAELRQLCSLVWLCDGCLQLHVLVTNSLPSSISEGGLARQRGKAGRRQHGRAPNHAGLGRGLVPPYFIAATLLVWGLYFGQASTNYREAAGTYARAPGRLR